ncbi:MAG: DUF1549 domain-containing protein [Planctomycetaceae bacterium]
MKLRAALLPVLVAFAVCGLSALAVRSPIAVRPAALQTTPPDDVTPVVEQIDREFARRWEAEGLQSAPLVEDELTILRRLALALHGTIPSLEEIRAFEADRGDDRLARWTTAMLDDTRFADYFAQRLSRAYVGVDEGQFILFRRDRFGEWLSEQLREHAPYDQIVRMMLTGAGVWTGDPEANFLTAAYANDQFDRNELAGRTVRAFLGQRIDCAQCHDHPFAHWKQTEFEGLTAHFSELQVSLVGVEDKSGLRYETNAEDASKLSAGQISDDVRKVLRQNKLKIPDNATVEPASGPGTQWVVLVPHEGEAAMEGGAKPDVRAVVRREGDQLRVYDPLREHIIDNEGKSTIRVAPPSVPFGREWEPATGTRRERLAAWVTHPDNKRFERAIANRIWGLMFGKPCYTAAAVDDLPDPDNPDSADVTRVLDLLGADFRAHNCDLRRLIRVITASKPFRLASTHPVELALERDEPLSDDARRELKQTVITLQQNWAVFPLVRLRPEQFIGSMLQARHLTTIDQNSHLFVRATRFFRERDFVNEFGDPGEAELEPRVGTIPQALLKMNGQFSRELTEAGPFNSPGRISAMSSNTHRCLETAYLVCLTRRPTAAEADFFVNQLNEARGKQRGAAMQDLFWTLFNATEFSWNH